MRIGSRGRRGWVSLLALLSLMVLLAALAVAVNANWLGTARQDLQSAADAAALAGAGELVSDEWLRLGLPGVPALLASSRATTAEYAHRNRALGRPVVLTDDDIALGHFDADGDFVPADDSPTQDEVDTVVATARRLRSRGTAVPVLLGALLLTPTADVQATAAARLDRMVIGLEATPGRPIPVVPLGLRSDPTATNPLSWEHQVIARNGPDEDSFSPDAGFTAGTDGIPEFDVLLPLAPSGDLSAGSGYLLQLGTGDAGTQVTGGVTAEDLSATSGRLVLGNDNTLAVPATTGPEHGSPEYNQLRDGLEQLRQERAVRVFPLVLTGDRINAFVAARVVRITESPTGPLVVRLQPAMLAVPQAITDGSRVGANLLPSPYLARPRLVR